jgi:hypothetical protein
MCHMRRRIHVSYAEEDTCVKPSAPSVCAYYCST